MGCGSRLCVVYSRTKVGGGLWWPSPRYQLLRSLISIHFFSLPDTQTYILLAYVPQYATLNVTSSSQSA